MLSHKKARKAQRNFAKTIVCCLCLIVAVMGQAPNEPVLPKNDASQPPVPGQVGGTHEMTGTDVEAFLDGFVPQQIKEADIAGVTISIVKDGNDPHARL